jgi:hypothetical protein
VDLKGSGGRAFRQRRDRLAVGGGDDDPAARLLSDARTEREPIGDNTAMTVVFELAWPQDYAGRGEEWFAIGHEPDGRWWYDGWEIGRVPIGRGAGHVAEFARWLLAERPAGRYETEFALLDGEKPVSDFWDPTMVFTIDVLLGRQQEGDPEHLLIYPVGYFPRSQTYAHICDELSWEPVDRDHLRIQAAALLDAAQTSGPVTSR